MQILIIIIQILKFYQCLINIKLILDWLPKYNPYIWPISIITMLTKPYFQFWYTLFPHIRYKGFTINAAHTIAIELIKVLIHYLTLLLFYLEYFNYKFLYYIKYKLNQIKYIYIIKIFILNFYSTILFFFKKIYLLLS
jgi:hypothetical protein